MLIVFVAIIYGSHLVGALSMNKESYNCTQDSMMMLACRDPFGNSALWTLLYVGAFGWPLVLAWAISGIVVFVKRSKSKDATA